MSSVPNSRTAVGAGCAMTHPVSVRQNIRRVMPRSAGSAMAHLSEAHAGRIRSEATVRQFGSRIKPREMKRWITSRTHPTPGRQSALQQIGCRATRVFSACFYRHNGLALATACLRGTPAKQSGPQLAGRFVWCCCLLLLSVAVVYCSCLLLLLAADNPLTDDCRSACSCPCRCSSRRGSGSSRPCRCS